MSEQEMLRWQQVSIINNLHHESYQKEEMCTNNTEQFYTMYSFLSHPLRNCKHGHQDYYRLSPKPTKIHGH